MGGGGGAFTQPTAPGCRRPCRLPLAFELLHDLQEAIVGGRVAAEADLHLVEVGESVLHLRRTKRLRVGRGRAMHRPWDGRPGTGKGWRGAAQGLEGNCGVPGRADEEYRGPAASPEGPRRPEEFRVEPRTGGEDRRVSGTPRGPLESRGAARTARGHRGGPGGSGAHGGVPGMTGAAGMTEGCRADRGISRRTELWREGMRR